MSCSPGSPVTWTEIRALAAAVDAMASTLGVQGFSKILSDNSTPFPLSGVRHVGGAYSVFYSPGSANIISDQRMSTSMRGGALNMGEPFNSLAASGDLYFVHQADSCWCKTIFKVLPNAFFRWDETGGSDPLVECGCQTLTVNEPGQRTDASQFIIPPSYSAQWATRYVAGKGDAPWWDTGPKCVNGGQVDYYFVPGNRSNEYWLNRADLLISGYFTWPIRKKWMDRIKQGVMEIVSGTCGAKDGMIFKDGSTTEYVKTGCAPTFADLQWTLLQNNTSFGGQPGCMTESNVMPWNTSTCGGQTCSNGPQVYCATLDQFSALVKELANQLYEYSKPCEACKVAFESCSFTIEFVDENRCEDDAYNIYINDKYFDFIDLASGCCGGNLNDEGCGDGEPHPDGECPQTTITKNISDPSQFGTSVQPENEDGSCCYLRIKLELNYENQCDTLTRFQIIKSDQTVYQSQYFGQEGLEAEVSLDLICDTGAP